LVCRAEVRWPAQLPYSRRVASLCRALPHTPPLIRQLPCRASQGAAVDGVPTTAASPRSRAESRIATQPSPVASWVFPWLGAGGASGPGGGPQLALLASPSGPPEAHPPSLTRSGARPPGRGGRPGGRAGTRPGPR
jgi:hypothetical protein